MFIQQIPRYDVPNKGQINIKTLSFDPQMIFGFMGSEQHVIGLDFGTDSVRAVLVNASNGRVVDSNVHWYERWKSGLHCDASKNQYRQHPMDHIEGMEETIKGVLSSSEIDPRSIKGICVDTTGSSPIAVDAEGQPLCFRSEFSENPNAMMVLWKDHTAIKEAENINRFARTWGGTDFTKYEGGIYSSEWFWAKIWHISKTDLDIRNAAHSWMEHCDLMTYLLVGSPKLATFKRSRCAAGHKAMWHEEWGGLPEDQFLLFLDSGFPTLKNQLYKDTYTSDESAGFLCSEWAKRLGLSTDVVISVGTFDAHAGAVGAEIEEGTLVRVMGTSTCDIIVAPKEVIGRRTVRGICGQVDGSVLPGMIGLEAGQSAFGDVLAWFKEVLSWPLENLSDISAEQVDKIKNEIIEKLSEQANQLPKDRDKPVALDWINGRRTPDADQSLKLAIMNLNLGTKAPEIFRSLIEAICFGSKMIVERFELEGVTIKSVVGIGGVAKKSAFVMQTLADVLNMPIKIVQSDQAPALGAAMYAATAAGIYPDVQSAIKAMGNGFEKTYIPNEEHIDYYQEMFEKYKSLGHFVENEN